MSAGRVAGQRTLQTLTGAGLLALVTGVLASTPAQAASPSSITGVVTDSVTSAPIAGVTVATNPASVTATTNGSGAYTLNLTVGTYDVLFTLSGYNSNFVGAVNAPANGTVTANQALVRVPAQAAQDLFSRPDQSGIGPASDGHTWSNDLNIFPTATTSIAGRQFFVQTATANTDHDTWTGIAYRDEEISADINMINLRQDAFQHGGRVLARVQGSDQWIVLTLNPSNSTLTIWVDANGNWAQIGSVAHAFSTNAWYHTKIDVIGSNAYGKAWAFGSAEPAWQVSGIQSSITSPGVGGLRVGAADVYFASYLETPITEIAGKVTNAGTGAALAGVTVSLNTHATATTDAEGKYVFGGLAAGTYAVSAAAPGYNPGSASATVSTGLSALGTNLALMVQLATLSASPSTVNPGGSTVMASWSGIASPTAGDWIGLYSAGAPYGAYIKWQYTTGIASGNVPFSLPASLGPGTYELRLFANNSSTLLATSGAITIQLATLSASPSTVNPGGTVMASWSGIASPTAGDWIGLYSVGAPYGAYIKWQYTTGVASGNVPFTLPASLGPGTYELRLFANNSSALLAISGPITVT
jgi:hypothetical protein